jgi:RNA polymerase sigma-70 factor (ECF subfamily)
MTEEALMLDIKKGNLDKASELYDLYSKRLYNYFVRISFDRDLSYDMMQDTFLRMIKYRISYQEEKPFKAWIYQIARNVFADSHKKNRFVYTGLPLDMKYENHSEDIEETDDLVHRKNILEKSMLKLPDDYREVLVLSRYEEMKYHDIANVMGISVSHVKVKVHRAIKKLREYYFEFDNAKY